jgi:exopolysaccharide production protein ExoY
MDKHRKRARRGTTVWSKNTRLGGKVRDIAEPALASVLQQPTPVLRIGKAMHASNAAYLIGTSPSLPFGKQFGGSLTTSLVLPGRSRSERSVRTGKSQLPLGGLPKRIVDIVVASAALVAMAPVMLMVTALIRIVMGGPVIFSQERVGYGGRRFTCFKFRTMVANGDEVLRRHLEARPEAAREWKETRKLANDPRVGYLGNLLRKSSIDELPQLFNVLRGDMSLVGPRPVVPDELEYYGRHVHAYLKARPGLTGVWQVSGRNRLSYAGRVARDRHYARHWSLAVDLAVLIKTIPAILKFSETA